MLARKSFALLLAAPLMACMEQADDSVDPAETPIAAGRKFLTVRMSLAHRATVSSLSSLEPMLGPSVEPARVAIEACREAWFIHATLTGWGNEVLLVDTTRSRQMGVGQHRRKTHRIDAEVMALAVESGRIPLAHLLSPHRQQLRRQLGVRRGLVETRSQYVTTMRGLAREYGCSLPPCDPEQFVSKVRQARLSPEVRSTTNAVHDDRLHSLPPTSCPSAVTMK